MITRRSIRTFLAGGAIVALAGLALAACGSSGSSKASTQPPQTSSGTPATVGVTNTSLGNILVDAQGKTLYMFGKDTGTTSTCTGACATNWPPLMASSAPTTGGGANASLVGTTMRPEGKTQVTYNGHPVYNFVGDKSPGDTNGEGLTAFGGSWFALDASGNQVSPPASNSGSGGIYG